jgi:hypothetical protein
MVESKEFSTRVVCVEGEWNVAGLYRAGFAGFVVGVNFVDQGVTYRSRDGAMND